MSQAEHSDPQDEYLWTKGTWRDYKLTFPLQPFGFHQPVADAAAAEPAAGAASNTTGAAKAGDSAAAKEAEQDQKSQALRRLPAEVSTPELEAAVRGYEAVSLRGAVRPTSGDGAPHEGMKLAAGWASYPLNSDPSCFTCGTDLCHARFAPHCRLLAFDSCHSLCVSCNRTKRQHLHCKALDILLHADDSLLCWAGPRSRSWRRMRWCQRPHRSLSARSASISPRKPGR